MNIEFSLGSTGCGYIKENKKASEQNCSQISEAGGKLSKMKLK